MKLHHIALTIKDLTRSISFYSEFFDFKEVKRFRRDDMKAIGVFLQAENIIIELWEFDTLTEGVREEFSHTGIKHIAFTYNDLETLREKFIANGIACSPIQEGKSGGLYFFISDPDGNQIEIYKPIFE